VFKTCPVLERLLLVAASVSSCEAGVLLLRRVRIGKAEDLRDVTPCILVDGCWPFGGVYMSEHL
jgi:hypothetical protein